MISCRYILKTGCTWLLMALALVCVVAFQSCVDNAMSNDVIASNDRFTVTGDSVAEGNSIAYAPSATCIISKYASPATVLPSVLRVKLAINARDNELQPGRYHYVKLGADTTIVACHVSDTLDATLASDTATITGARAMTLHVDLREMFNSFKQHGWWVTAAGDTVFQAEYNGVWLVGDVAPLSWDYFDLEGRQAMRLSQTKDEGIYAIRLSFGNETSIAQSREWRIKEPLEQYAQVESGQTLIDALYNMAIDGMHKHITSNGARLGSELTTADVSLAVMLSLTTIAPAVAMQVMYSCVHDSVIVASPGQPWQLNATGSAMWVTAAWDVYCATGNKAWLEWAFAVAEKTMEQNRNMLTNRYTGLLQGEGYAGSGNNGNCYAAWMGAQDKFESMTLSANVIVEHAYEVMSSMSEELEKSTSYDDVALRLKDAINQSLWDEARSRYSSMLYGGVYPVKSPLADNMAQALAVLWEIADDDRAENLLGKTPVSDYGVNTIYPGIIGDEAQGRNDVWLMPQALWNLASAKLGNENMLRRGLAAMVRANAFACANVERMSGGSPVAGGEAGQFMSAVGMAAMNLRLLAGIRYLPSGIEFKPFVPNCMQGIRRIKGLRYRNAVLDISIEGAGNEVASMYIDGKKVTDAFVPSTIAGHHEVVVNLQWDSQSRSNVVAIDNFCLKLPTTPIAVWNDSALRIVNYTKGLGYRMLMNGGMSYNVSAPVFTVPGNMRQSYVSLLAINRYGMGLMSRPAMRYSSKNMSYHAISKDYDSEADFNGQTATIIRSVELSPSEGDTARLVADVPKAGVYLLDVLYANGHEQGSAACAWRQVWVNGHFHGLIAMPSAGYRQWHVKQWSSTVPVAMLQGRNVVELRNDAPMCGVRAVAYCARLAKK